MTPAFTAITYTLIFIVAGLTAAWLGLFGFTIALVGLANLLTGAM